MSKIPVVTVVVLLLLSPCLAQTSAGAGRQGGAIEQELIELERIKDGAYRRGDKDTLDRIYADDYVAVAALGNFTTKKEVLGIFVRPDIYEAYESDEIKVRVFGDSAAVTGRLKFRYYKGITPANKDQFRYTNIYVRQQGRWRIVAAQFTRIEK